MSDGGSGNRVLIVVIVLLLAALIVVFVLWQRDREARDIEFRIESGTAGSWVSPRRVAAATADRRPVPKVGPVASLGPGTASPRATCGRSA